jgi:mRNA interferase RelE/StbE
VAGYRLLIKPSAAKEIETLGQKKDRQRIVNRIAALASEPRPTGCEKLAGAEGRYRIRQGEFRSGPTPLGSFSGFLSGNSAG